MRFKTVIKIVSDANNRSEALDLVEEYLAGNISSGVNMRCVTKPVCSKTKVAGVMALSLIMVAGIFLTVNAKHPQMLQTVRGIDAVQPPLKTSNAAKIDSDFKKEWQAIQTKEGLEKITR